MKKFAYLGIALFVIACLISSISCSKAAVTNPGGIQSYSSDKFGGVTSTPINNGARFPTITQTTVSMYSNVSGGQGNVYNSALSTDIQRMIVRTSNITLVVGDVVTALDKITNLAEDNQGYVVSSNKWKDNGSTLGTITIRVPAGQFDSAMSALRNMSDEVTAENTSSQDVTQEYVDLNSTLKNLQATEAQLLQIMTKADKVPDIMAVQEQLTNIQGQIETTKGRMQYLEQTAATSLITVSLTQSKLSVNLIAVNGRNIGAGDAVAFSPEVSGGFAPYNYKWDFGDSSTSTDEMPVHTYSNTGKFTVSLSITDDKGNTAVSTRADYITVESGWNAGKVAGNAWKGLASFGRVVVNILIWLGIFSPVWIIIGVVVYLALRRNKKKAVKNNIAK
jgi:TolA-binding protein